MILYIQNLKDSTRKLLELINEYSKVAGYTPLYSCLENTVDRGAWQATVHGVSKSQTQLSN